MTPHERQKFSLLKFLTTVSATSNLTTFFSRHLHQVHLHGPFNLALSGVARPLQLHRHVRPLQALHHQRGGGALFTP